MSEKGKVADVLKEADLTALRSAYAATRGTLDTALKEVIPGQYRLSEIYVEAVNEIFQGKLPKELEQDRRALSVLDRERCLIAVLTARPDQFNLGLHIYIGLMEGLTPEEIANIILLAGIYTGVDNLSRALDTQLATLNVLKQKLGERDIPRNPMMAPTGTGAILGALKGLLEPARAAAAGLPQP